MLTGLVICGIALLAVASIALGAVRNTEWLAASGLRADPGGVDCAAEGYVLDEAGQADTRIAAAGDVEPPPAV